MLDARTRTHLRVAEGIEVRRDVSVKHGTGFWIQLVGRVVMEVTRVLKAVVLQDGAVYRCVRHIPNLIVVHRQGDICSVCCGIEETRAHRVVHVDAIALCTRACCA